MKRLTLPAAAALAALAPGTAAAKPPTLAHARAYEQVYRDVAHAFGRRAPGRNIVEDGVAPNRAATDADVVASLAVLQRMLAPTPTPAATPSSTTGAQVPAASSAGSGGGSGGLPSCAAESGSNYSIGPDNTNASSGATGRYQITPSTAANYGCNLSTAGGQDACAQTIYRNQGASAWTGCGG